MTQLSVDLGLAIERIGTRQHLNDVHFTVQLVRQALRAGPGRIELSSRRRTFTLEHDGAAFSADEADALRVLFAEVRDPAAVDAALVALEQQHGITLLGAALGDGGVEVHSAVSFAIRGGRFSPLPTARAGCRIVVHRRRKSRRRERAELRFYCRDARVPIVLDGRALNPRPKSAPPDDALAAHTLPPGPIRGWLAVPRDGDSSTTRYYENGVYFGVRRAVHHSRIPLDASVDHETTVFDPNFRQAVRRSHRAISEHMPGVLARLDPAALDENARRRTTALLLRAMDRLPPSAHALPFLPSQDGHTLSVDDIQQLADRYSLLPYVPEGSAFDGPGRWPTLTPERAGQLARAVGTTPAILRAAPAPPPAPPPPPPDDSAARDLVGRLAAQGHRLEVAPPGTAPAHDPRTHAVRLPADHPDLARASAAPPARIEAAWALVTLAAQSS